MYCSTCGNQLDAKLNYCNRCGARLDRLATTDDPTGVQHLSMATGFVGLGGLGLTVGLIAILLSNGVAQPVIILLPLLFLAAVCGISFLMIRQISRMAKPENKIRGEQSPAALDTAYAAPRLAENQTSFGSVTDATTRSFEEIPAERK